MWWIERSTVYRSTSKIGLEGTWSKKQKVNLDFEGKRLIPWHLDVFKDNGNYKLYYSGMGKNKKWFVGLSQSKDLNYWEGQY